MILMTHIVTFFDMLASKVIAINSKTSAAILPASNNALNAGDSSSGSTVLYLASADCTWAKHSSVFQFSDFSFGPVYL